MSVHSSCSRMPDRNCQAMRLGAFGKWWASGAAWASSTRCAPPTRRWSDAKRRSLFFSDAGPMRKAGDGHAVLLSGEPGVGKSRLAAAIEERLGEESHHRLRYFCSPYHQNSALYPFIAQLEKLEELLAALSPIEEDIALFADLLSLGVSPRYPALDFMPQRKKEKTFAAWLRQVEALSCQRPVLIVFEDLQWIDPTSRELLDLIIERLESWPVLLITTFRSEYQPPWTGQPAVTAMSLNRLNRRNSAMLVQGLIGAEARLSNNVADAIVERCDGVPKS